MRDQLERDLAEAFARHVDPAWDDAPSWRSVRARAAEDRPAPRRRWRRDLAVAVAAALALAGAVAAVAVRQGGTTGQPPITRPPAHAAGWTWVGRGEVRTLDGGLVVRLPERVQAVAWSPDGTRLAAAEQSGSGCLLVVIDVPSGREHALARCGSQEQAPSWSPDGATIAFTRWGYETSRVVVIGADGTGERTIASGFAPTWAPDGRMIVYGTLRKGSTRAPRCHPLAGEPFQVCALTNAFTTVWTTNGRIFRLYALETVVSSNARGGGYRVHFRRDFCGACSVPFGWAVRPDGSEIAVLDQGRLRTFDPRTSIVLGLGIVPDGVREQQADHATQVAWRP